MSRTKTAFTTTCASLLMAAAPLVAAPAKASFIATPSAVTQGAAKLVSHHAPTEKLRFTIVLKPPKEDEEERFLEELNTKESPNFHKFLTPEEWNARFAPSAADEQAVVDWATSNGLSVTQRHPHRLTISLEGDTDHIEKAFGVHINNYQLGALSFYSNDSDPVLPAHLATVVESVMGLNSKVQLLPKLTGHRMSNEQPAYVAGPAFVESGHGAHNGSQSLLASAVKASQEARKNAGASGPGPNVTGGSLDPTDLYDQNAYNWEGLNNQHHCCNPFGGSDSPPEASIAIATAYAIDPNDITGFHNTYPYLADHWNTYNIDGTPQCPASDSQCAIETTLDFEWATAMANSFGAAADTAHVHIYQGVNPNFSTFTDVVSRILSDNKVRVVSLSWGCAESDCWDGGDMNALHNVFNAMAGQGYSIVIASGDNGATASAGAGSGCEHHLAVDYPGSDPNVVSAGGTELFRPVNNSFSSEIAWEGDTFTGACGDNLGGSGGGLSAVWDAPSWQTPLGFSKRAVPDVSLNAISFQNFFFQGTLQGGGGTSIVAPELAGFFAQENAYLLAFGTGCGASHAQTCAPMGNPNQYIYFIGRVPAVATFYPFYDITSGCNSNDVTIAFGTGDFCAQAGYDQVTGWGSINALQMAWGINAYLATDSFAPNVTFFGPVPNVWYNSDQAVLFSVADVGNTVFPANGVGGYSQAWDTDPGNIADRGTPNAFRNAPQFPNGVSGSMLLSAAGQGCHQANVRTWDNAGTTANNQSGSYCFDTVSPVTIASFSGTTNSSGIYTSNVTVTLSGVDISSGVSSIFYSLDGRTFLTYSAPFTISAPGTYTLRFYSTDVAGNVDTTHVEAVTVKQASTVTSVTSSLNPATYGLAVTFTARVTAPIGPVPTGTVTFKDGSVILGTGTLASGKATFTTNLLHGGAHAITAVYSGSGADLTSVSAAFSEQVSKASTTTSDVSSLNPSTYGKPVTLTAAVVPAHGGLLSGGVIFKDGATVIGSAPVNPATNKATFTTSTLIGGVHDLTATYAGDGDLLPSSSAVIAETINKTASTTTLVSSQNPSAHGTSVTFTATIALASGSAFGGSVTFKDGTVTLGSVAVNTSTHKATFASSSLSIGAHSITAVYSGNINVKGSTSAVVSQVVR